MNLSELEELFEIELEPIYDANESRALFSLAAEQVLGVRPLKLKLTNTDQVSFINEQKILSILNDLMMGKPIQHILEEAHFYGLVFKVNASVLIPRPETEELVDWIIQELRTRPDKKFQILDVGTGSGCIPIALKKNLPDTEITSIDVSAKALDVATENADKMGASVNFIEADILDFSTDSQFDIIVSNPPYITPKEKIQMHENVLAYEPHLALFVTEEDPLVFYKAIANLALNTLASGGRLFFEINSFLGPETVQMLSEKGFSLVELRKDIQGNDRMIKAML